MAHLTRWIRPIVVAAAVACVCLPASRENALAQQTTTPHGHAERSDAGDWYGSWYYVSRQYKVALWIRDAKGTPEIKLQILDTSKGESVITDWTTHATYSHRGRRGNLLMTFEHRDENVIEGGWFWELINPDFLRLDTAKITIYRAQRGRALVMQFDNWERVHRSGDNERQFAQPHAWTFRKASRREIGWFEMPF